MGLGCMPGFRSLKSVRGFLSVVGSSSRSLGSIKHKKVSSSTRVAEHPSAAQRPLAKAHYRELRLKRRRLNRDGWYPAVCDS